MSNYNHYARKLNNAFLKAREMYVAAYDQLKTAQQRVEDGKTLKDRRFEGEADLERSMLETDLRRAELVFEQTSKNCWPAFNDIVDELTAELQEVVATDGMANPEAVDTDGLTLLQSGIALRPEELEALRVRYENNSTMLRVLAPYVEKAFDAEQNLNKRKELAVTKNLISDGLDGVLRRWSDLLEAAKVCSGQSRDRQEDPSFITKISQKWEELTAATVENF